MDEILTRMARPTAYRFADRMVSPYVDVATLRSAADAAVWEAAARFDPARGAFVPFAMRFVKAAVIGEVRQAETLLSRHDFTARAKVRQGRAVPDAQAARVSSAPRRAAMPETDVTADPPAASGRDDTTVLAAAARTPREFFAAVRFTGADGAPPSSYAEIGAWLGESKETVRRRVQRVGAAIAATAA